MQSIILIALSEIESSRTMIFFGVGVMLSRELKVPSIGYPRIVVSDVP